ncbi:MAG: hypothetical protein U9Q67_04160, partial [Patescibacteria group bacterium]|nr:hypothetical protein [Patescibacteria group bacterium]
MKNSSLNRLSMRVLVIIIFFLLPIASAQPTSVKEQMPLHQAPTSIQGETLREPYVSLYGHKT